MSAWSRARAIIDRVRHRGRDDRALHEELESYLGMDADAKARAGVSPDEARRQALIEFGGVEQVKEQTRDARAGATLDAVLQDLRYAARTLRHAPAFSLSVVGSLAAGLAAVIAATALIDAVSSRVGARIADPSALVELTPYRRCANERPDCFNLIPTGADEARVLLSSESAVFESVVAETRGTVAAALPEPRSLRARFVSTTYFDLLRVRVSPGRAFVNGEDRAGVAVLSHRLWQRSFGGEIAAVGRTVRLAGEEVRIIGVAPAGFGGIGGGSDTDLWLPIDLADRVANALPASASTVAPLPAGQRYRRYVGRLNENVDLDRARTAADLLAPRMQAAGTVPGRAVWIDVAPVGRVDVERMAMLIGLLMPVPLLVLALGCVNAANLLLARASARSREIAVRLAIGASRQRIVRQLLIESVVLSAAAVLASAPLVWLVLDSASSYLDLSMKVDASVVVAAIAAAVASAIGFGLVPALRITRGGPAGALTQVRAIGGTPGQVRGRHVLVSAQIALSLALLAAGFQFVNALASEAPSAGTRSDRLILASFDLGQPNISSESAAAFYPRVLERVSALPGVESAGLASQRTLWTFGRGHQADNSILIWGPDDPPREGRYYLGGYTGGRFIEAVGLQVLAGRAFQADDANGGRPRVAVVNRSFARTVFNDAAVGRTVRVAPIGEGYSASIEVEIVGVVDGARDPGFSRSGAPAIYVPMPLRPARALTLFVRSRTPIDDLGPAIRAAVRDLDPTLPFTLATLEQVTEDAFSKQNWLARAAAVLGGVALLLATLGLYALVSFLVAMRSREFAIRLALGAAPSDVLTLVMWHSLRLAAVGAIVGGAVAIGVGQIIRSEVHSAPAVDVAALAGSSFALIIAMLAASALPAARAARVDPIGLLKD